MIQRFVGICLLISLCASAPLSKGIYSPASLGSRPPCATKRLTFCEDVDKYPTKLIQKLLQSKTFAMHDFFIDESKGLEEPPEYFLHQDLIPTSISEVKPRKIRDVNSVPPEGKLSRACLQNRTATPKLASNSKGEWRFIAQDETINVHQKFKVQLCNDSEDCRKSCTQFYTPVPMLSVNSSGNVTTDFFWLPSTCRCFDDTVNMV